MLVCPSTQPAAMSVCMLNYLINLFRARMSQLFTGDLDIHTLFAKDRTFSPINIKHQRNNLLILWLEKATCTIPDRTISVLCMWPSSPYVNRACMYECLTDKVISKGRDRATHGCSAGCSTPPVTVMDFLHLAPPFAGLGAKTRCV